MIPAGAVTMMPNIFIFLEADVLGGRLDSKKWVQAYFTWPKFSVVWKSRYLMNQSYVATNTVRYRQFDMEKYELLNKLLTIFSFLKI